MQPRLCAECKANRQAHAPPCEGSNEAADSPRPGLLSPRSALVFTMSLLVAAGAGYLLHAENRSTPVILFTAAGVFGVTVAFLHLHIGGPQPGSSCCECDGGGCVAAAPGDGPGGSGSRDSCKQCVIALALGIGIGIAVPFAIAALTRGGR